MRTYLKKLFVVGLIAASCVTVMAGLASAKSTEAGTGYVQPKIGFYGSSNNRINSAFTYGGEAGFFFMDNVSMAVELMGMALNQKKDPLGVSSSQTYPNAFAPMAFARYHFLTQERFGLFAGLGLGGFFATDRVPANGERSNLSEAGEVGFNTSLNDVLSLQLSGRWQHVGPYWSDTGFNLWGGNMAVKYSF